MVEALSSQERGVSGRFVGVGVFFLADTFERVNPAHRRVIGRCRNPNHLEKERAILAFLKIT